MTAQRALELLQLDTDSDDSRNDSEGEGDVLIQCTTERGDMSHNNDFEDDDNDTTSEDEDEEIQPLRKRIKGNITTSIFQLCYHILSSVIFYAGFESSTEDTPVSSTCINSCVSKDGTRWSKVPSRTSSGRTPASNIIRSKGGASRFIQNRVDEIKDVFFELIGTETIEKIRTHTIAQPRRRGDETFDVTVEELHAFLGLSLIRGVLKGE